MARRTDAENIGVTRSFETTSVGQTSIALVAVVIVVETVGARMVVVADAQIDAVEEAKEMSILHAHRVILDHRKC